MPIGALKDHSQAAVTGSREDVAALTAEQRTALLKRLPKTELETALRDPALSGPIRLEVANAL